MTDHRPHAKQCISNLKDHGADPFEEMRVIAENNGLDICRGEYTAWQVLELMIMLDSYVRCRRASELSDDEIALIMESEAPEESRKFDYEFKE